MKKIIFLMFLFSVSMVSAMDKEVPPQYYYSFSMGGDQIKDIKMDGYDLEFKKGLYLDAAVGRYYGDIRGELELSHRNALVNSYIIDGVHYNDETKTRLKNTSLMGNVYYDFKLDSQFSPYLGMGIGLVNSTMSMSIEGTNISASGTDFGLQMMVGVSYAFSEETAMTLEYKHSKIYDDDVIQSNALILGVRRNF